VHNNPPPESALAKRHGERRPRLNDAARPQRPIASTAPASPEPAGRPAATSGSSTNAQRVKCWRISSANDHPRRTQPRTVDSGTPSSAAIGLNPRPPAASNSARPITSTASSRRHRHTHGNSTCHAPQPRHRARRGRSHNSSAGTPPATRTGRGRASPRGATGDPQPGQASRPARKSRSTTSLSASTMSSGDAPAFDHQDPPAEHHERTGGSSHVQHQIIAPPATTSTRSRPNNHVITPNVAAPPERDQNECRLTTGSRSPVRCSRKLTDSFRGHTSTR
jgi:hypothetical protein